MVLPIVDDAPIDALATLLGAEVPAALCAVTRKYHAPAARRPVVNCAVPP